MFQCTPSATALVRAKHNAPQVVVLGTHDIDRISWAGQAFGVPSSTGFVLERSDGGLDAAYGQIAANPALLAVPHHGRTKTAPVVAFAHAQLCAALAQAATTLGDHGMLRWHLVLHHARTIGVLAHTPLPTLETIALAAGVRQMAPADGQAVLQMVPADLRPLLAAYEQRTRGEGRNRRGDMDQFIDQVLAAWIVTCRCWRPALPEDVQADAQVAWACAPHADAVAARFALPDGAAAR